MQSQQDKAEKAALVRAKELAKVTAATTKSKKEQLALEKAKAALAKAQSNFDITKIQLAAALKGKVDDEEKNRLLAMQAIEENNGDLALSYIAKLDYARKIAAEAETARQKALMDSIQARMDNILALQDRINAKIAGNSASSTAAATVSDIQARMDAISALQDRVNAKIAGNSVTVNVAGSIVSQQELVGVVRDGLLNDSLSAKQANVDRQLGSFIS